MGILYVLMVGLSMLKYTYNLITKDMEKKPKKKKGKEEKNKREALGRPVGMM